MQTILRFLIVASFLALIGEGCGEGDQTNSATDASDAEDTAETAECVAKAFVPEADQFGAEQVMVVYDLEGQETGTRTLWVENYGACVGMEDSLSVFVERLNCIIGMETGLI